MYCAVEAFYYAHKLARDMPVYEQEWAIAIIMARIVEEMNRQAQTHPTSTVLRIPAPKEEWEASYCPLAVDRLNSALLSTGKRRKNSRRQPSIPGTLPELKGTRICTTRQWHGLSEDMLGFNGEDTNPARYVGNSPTNATDPMGLEIPDVLKPNPALWAINAVLTSIEHEVSSENFADENKGPENSNTVDREGWGHSPTLNAKILRTSLGRL